MHRIKSYLEAVDELAPLVDADAEDADRRGHLSDAVVQAMHATGLLRMLLAEPDGGGLRLGDTFPVVEAMAAVDGAAGWNLAIGANSLAVVAWNAGADLRGEIAADPRALVASSFNPAGLCAEITHGGVVVDGRMTFASGSPHATLLAAVASIDDGPPIVAVFDPGAATPVDSWHVAGMRATGSHDWLVPRVFVPDGRWFRGTSLGSPATDVMASLPLFSLLGPSLAFVALGIARHAIDLLVDVAASALRERPDVQVAAAEATASVDAGRALLTTTWFDLETALLAGGGVETRDLARLRLASVTATRLAAEATDRVQRASGSSGLYEARGIARCWRDVHAVTQHAMVSHRHLDRIGRVLLGLGPGPGPV